MAPGARCLVVLGHVETRFAVGASDGGTRLPISFDYDLPASEAGGCSGCSGRGRMRGSVQRTRDVQAQFGDRQGGLVEVEDGYGEDDAASRNRLHVLNAPKAQEERVATDSRTAATKATPARSAGSGSESSVTISSTSGRRWREPIASRRFIALQSARHPLAVIWDWNRDAAGLGTALHYDMTSA